MAISKWLLGFKRGRKNYERINPRFCLIHDTGFGGGKLYQVARIEKNSYGVDVPGTLDTMGGRFEKRADALRRLKELDGGRTNPARTSANPSDSVLKGAKILGTVRNSRGTVTGLRVQLRPGAKAAGGGAGAGRSNPEQRREYWVGFKHNTSRISPIYATREEATAELARIRKRDPGLKYAVVKTVARLRAKRSNPTQPGVGINYNVTLDGEWYDTYPGAYDGAANALKRARAAGKALAKRRAGVVRVETAGGKVLAVYNRKGK